MTCWPHSELQAALKRRNCNSFTAVWEEIKVGEIEMENDKILYSDNTVWL